MRHVRRRVTFSPFHSLGSVRKPAAWNADCRSYTALTDVGGKAFSAGTPSAQIDPQARNQLDWFAESESHKISSSYCNKAGKSFRLTLAASFRWRMSNDAKVSASSSCAVATCKISSLSTEAMARRPIARQPGTSIAFYRKGSAVVAEITIYLLGLFLAHEWLENLLAIFCFLGEIAHFLKFSSTAHSAEPNNLRLLLPFRGDVLSVVFQKAARWIFWDFRHLNGLLTIRKQRKNSPQKTSPAHRAAEHLNRGRWVLVRRIRIS